MNQEVKNRLAESLTAESTEIIPYLPYLLQDFWSLASDSEEMIDLLQTHTNFGRESKLIDLACGKGAASIGLAREFGCTAKGVDLMEAFIAEAKEKADQYGVAEHCVFLVGDINDAVAMEKDYDLVIWGGSGDLLGSYPKTLEGLARTIKPGGYILLDDGYVREEQQDLRFHHAYLTKAQWAGAFEKNHLTFVACKEQEQQIDPTAYAEELGNIRQRAEELIRKHPDKRELFDGYVKSQQAEYQDLQDGFVPVLWLLKKNAVV